MKSWQEQFFRLIPAEFTWADYSSMKADLNLKKVGVKVHEQIYSICMIFNTRLEFDYADWWVELHTFSKLLKMYKFL